MAIVPIVVVALRVAIERTSVGPVLAFGMLVGFAGVGFLSFAHGERAEGTAIATTFVLIAAAVVGLGTFLVPRLPVSSDAFVSAGWQLLWAGALLVPVSVVTGEAFDFRLGEVGSAGVVAFVLLVTVGTVPPYVSYIWLLRHISSSTVAATGYVNPLVAVLLGWLVAGERLGLTTVLAGTMIVVSLILVTTREFESARARRSAPSITRGRERSPL